MNRQKRYVLTAIILSFAATPCLGAEDVPLFAPQGPASMHQLDFAPAGPEARKELSVKREENFEFAAAPRLTRAGDRVDIYFETKAFCDATVAVENSNGKIVRHLASGVLGSNAPEQFEKNSKKQHLVWDGKDDGGVFLDDKDALTVRVSLGLRANFEKNLHYHPMQALGRKPIIHAGPEGVFVYQSNVNHVWETLQQFDHEGHYVKTLHPFAANALDKIKGLNLIYAWPEDRKIPAKSMTMHGSLLPFVTSLFDNQPAVGDFTVRNGWITLIGKSNFARLGTDDTTRGEDLVGGSAELSSIKQSPAKSVAHRAAASLDGKWLYLTRAFGSRIGEGDDGVRMASMMDHAVYRVPFDGSAAPRVFMGDPHTKGSDNDHFNTPSGIAVDPQGRIYVSDWDNNRVQVFTPEGKFLKTIAAVGPADIAINQKTGEIYIFSWLLRWKVYGYAAEVPQIWRTGEGQDGDYNLRGSPIRVKKLTSLDAGAEMVYEEKLLLDGKPLERNASYAPASHAEIDSWAPNPVIWFVRPSSYGIGPARIWVLKEENKKLTLQYDFDKECEKAGMLISYRPGGNASPLQRQFLYFDPKHQVLYVGEPDQNEVKYFSKLLAIDVATGRESIVKLPFSAADAAIDAKGLIYLLNDDVVGRFDLETWREVPFDYGKNFASAGKIVAVAQTIGGHYSSYKHQSLGVSPQGDVIVAGYKGLHVLDRRKESAIDYGKTTWRPTVFPGRPSTNVCVNVFNIYGELVHEDVLAGIDVVTGGLDMDWHKNIYAAVPGARMLDNRPIKFTTGTLAKFKPEGGRFLTDQAGAMAPLDKKPDEPADCKYSSGADIWIKGAQWLFGGTPNGLLFLNCNCRQARFKTDYFGRSFVPEAWRYSVAVVDTAGNVILRIGQYGNVDSAGPKSLVPLGGDEIGLFDAQFLTVDTDRRVFIGDGANGRIVSGLLGYHNDQRLPLKEVADEAKK